MEVLEFKGKVISVLPVKEGVSQRSGKAWQIGGLVVETHDRYPCSAMFQVFNKEGEDKLAMIPPVGTEVNVAFDITCRPYNGNWYNSLNAYKIEVAGSTQDAILKHEEEREKEMQSVAEQNITVQRVPPLPTASQPAQPAQEKEDLPF